MTTRKFSATNLPHPRYTLELGRFNIGSVEQQKQQQQHQHKRQKLISDNTHQGNRTRACGGDGVEKQQERGQDNDKSSNVNLPSTCLPRFSQLAQVVEVKKPGLTLPNRVSSNIEDFLGSYCIIENARPELFIRRDFISKLVDKGTIFVAQLSDHQGTTATTIKNAPTLTDAETSAGSEAVLTCGYSLTTTKNNVMIITMNAKQYHRFGLLATKVISPLEPSTRNGRKGTKRACDKLYRIEINLNDERILKSNKYQDRLMQTLRRLSSVNKIYFRFVPDRSKLDISIAAAQKLSLEYFNYVINEYNLDGCKPVPLTRCSIGQQKVSRNWINYSQLHPSLELSKLIAMNGGRRVLFETQMDRGRDDEKLDRITGGMMEIVDWLGYQLLSLDCDKLVKINDGVASNVRRYDVSCTQIIGMIDFDHVQDNLDQLFAVDCDDDEDDEDPEVLFRALVLYDSRDDKQLLRSQDFDDGGLLHKASGATANDMDSASSAKHGEHSSPSGSALEGGWERNDCLCSSNRCVVYLQDCSNGSKAAREITVIGLSNLGI